jgi:hypothetical protein
VFELAARGAGFTRAWDRHAAHSQLMEVRTAARSRR